jgi:hypothetical protein
MFGVFWMGVMMVVVEVLSLGSGTEAGLIFGVVGVFVGDFWRFLWGFLGED